MSYLVLFVLVFFRPLSIAITSLGEERANLSVFFFICACLGLSVSSSSWCLGRAAVCDCGTPWTFLLLFLDQSAQPHNLDPVVQSIVSLTSSLKVKMLTDLVYTMSNSHVCLLKN